MSARCSRAAAERLVREFRRPILLAWAEEDHLLRSIRPVAAPGVWPRTVDDSCT